MSSDGSVCMVTGSLAPFETEFRAELARLGYTSSSIRGAVAATARLSRWLEDRALSPSGLTPRVVVNVRIAQLGPVLRFLREIGEVPAADSVIDATPVEGLLGEFRAWLAEERDFVRSHGQPVYRYRDLLTHLATFDRQTITFNSQQIEKLTTPTPSTAAPSNYSTPPCH